MNERQLSGDHLLMSLMFFILDVDQLPKAIELIWLYPVLNLVPLYRVCCQLKHSNRWSQYMKSTCGVPVKTRTGCCSDCCLDHPFSSIFQILSGLFVSSISDLFYQNVKVAGDVVRGGAINQSGSLSVPRFSGREIMPLTKVLAPGVRDLTAVCTTCSEDFFCKTFQQFIHKWITHLFTPSVKQKKCLFSTNKF